MERIIVRGPATTGDHERHVVEFVGAGKFTKDRFHFLYVMHIIQPRKRPGKQSLIHGDIPYAARPGKCSAMCAIYRVWIWTRETNEIIATIGGAYECHAQHITESALTHDRLWPRVDRVSRDINAHGSRAEHQVRTHSVRIGSDAAVRTAKGIINGD